jgi:hypothetical protein
MPAQLLLAYRESRSTLRVIADAGADYGEGRHDDLDAGGT